MAWYLVLIPAALSALVIRLDALYIGPYWTFMEVVPWMGGTDVDWWYKRPTLKWAVIRRYGWMVLLGILLSLYGQEFSTANIALVGTVTAGLLLWPILFHGLPLGVARSDWQLIPLYLSVILSFTAAPVVGDLIVEYVREETRGDVAGWLKDQAFHLVGWPLLLLIANAMFFGSYRSLRERQACGHL